MTLFFWAISCMSSPTLLLNPSVQTTIPCFQVDDWLQRSKHQRKTWQTQGSILSLQMSHNHELHKNLSQGFEPRTRNCWDQETFGWIFWKRRSWPKGNCRAYPIFWQVDIAIWKFDDTLPKRDGRNHTTGLVNMGCTTYCIYIIYKNGTMIDYKEIKYWDI